MGIVALGMGAVVGVTGWLVPSGPKRSGAGDVPSSSVATSGLPWQIERRSDGATHVMGLTLGHSRLDDARKQWPQGFRMAVVAGSDPAVVPVLEAFSDTVTVAGVVTGKMVLTAVVGPEDLQRWLARRVHTERTASGLSRSLLNPEDEAQAWRAPIRALTFVPTARVTAATLVARFGPPAQQWERDGMADEHDIGTVRHMAYPDVGLVVSVTPKGHAVLQYTHPQDIGWLLRGLHAPQVSATH